MRQDLGRFAVLLSVLALLVAACGQAPASVAPSASAAASVEPSAWLSGG